MIIISLGHTGRSTFYFFLFFNFLPSVLTPRRRRPSARGSRWPSRSPGNRGPWASWTACAPVSVVGRPFCYIYLAYIYMCILSGLLLPADSSCSFEMFNFGSFLADFCLPRGSLCATSSDVFESFSKILLIKNIFQNFLLDSIPPIGVLFVVVLLLCWQFLKRILLQMDLMLIVNCRSLFVL